MPIIGSLLFVYMRLFFFFTIRYMKTNECKFYECVIWCAKRNKKHKQLAKSSLTICSKF